jgi:hypothetical protein
MLFKVSVWDHDATYGAALQNLKYTDARGNTMMRPPPTSWQKGLLALFTVGGKYAWGKWEDWLVEHERGVDEVRLNQPDKDGNDANLILLSLRVRGTSSYSLERPMRLQPFIRLRLSPPFLYSL